MGERGREGGKHSASLFALLLKLCFCVYFPLDLLKQFSLLFTQYTCLATRVRVRVCACTCVCVCVFGLCKHTFDILLYFLCK